MIQRPSTQARKEVTVQTPSGMGASASTAPVVSNAPEPSALQNVVEAELAREPKEPTAESSALAAKLAANRMSAVPLEPGSHVNLAGFDVLLDDQTLKVYSLGPGEAATNRVHGVVTVTLSDDRTGTLRSVHVIIVPVTADSIPDTPDLASSDAAVGDSAADAEMGGKDERS